MTTTSETLASIRMRVDRESAHATGQTHLNLSPDFQREYEAWDEKLCTRLIESVLLHRAMNPIWVVANSSEKNEEVLDGKHRITTLIRFMNNQIAIGSSLMSMDKVKYGGKYFKDLVFDDQNRVRNYSFSINHLDSSYREDTDKLQDMYEILNRSSKPLNSFEFNKPIYKPLYDVITPFIERFKETPVYPKPSSKRGNVEREILTLIALTDRYVPDSFSSLPNYYDKWTKTLFGTNRSDVDEKVLAHKTLIEERCERILLYMNDFMNADLFKDVKDLMAIRIIVSRASAIVKEKTLFRRNFDSLVAKLRELLTSNLQTTLGCENRNATFQKLLIRAVDRLIEDEIGLKNEPRLFSEEMIARSKEEHGNKCAFCEKTIKATEKYDGDHIVPWISGGPTTYENLQVVHRKCHKRKEFYLLKKTNNVTNSITLS